jgi:hypothetical protein
LPLFLPVPRMETNQVPQLGSVHGKIHSSASCPCTHATPKGPSVSENLKWWPFLLQGSYGGCIFKKWPPCYLPSHAFFLWYDSGVLPTEGAGGSMVPPLESEWLGLMTSVIKDKTVSAQFFGWLRLGTQLPCCKEARAPCREAMWRRKDRVPGCDSDKASSLKPTPMCQHGYEPSWSRYSSCCSWCYREQR